MRCGVEWGEVGWGGEVWCGGVVVRCTVVVRRDGEACCAAVQCGGEKWFGVWCDVGGKRGVVQCGVAWWCGMLWWCDVMVRRGVV